MAQSLFYKTMHEDGRFSHRQDDDTRTIVSEKLQMPRPGIFFLNAISNKQDKINIKKIFTVFIVLFLHWGYPYSCIINNIIYWWGSIKGRKYMHQISAVFGRCFLSCLLLPNGNIAVMMMILMKMTLVITYKVIIIIIIIIIASSVLYNCHSNVFLYSFLLSNFTL